MFDVYGSILQTYGAITYMLDSSVSMQLWLVQQKLRVMWCDGAFCQTSTSKLQKDLKTGRDFADEAVTALDGQTLGGEPVSVRRAEFWFKVRRRGESTLEKVGNI